MPLLQVSFRLRQAWVCALLGIPSKWFRHFQKNWLFYRAIFPDTIRSHTESPCPCGWTQRAAMRRRGLPRNALQLQACQHLRAGGKTHDAHLPERLSPGLC